MEFLQLFLAGFLGGAHCLGMCGGIVTMMVGSGAQALWLYNFGRIAAYIAVGTALGALGEVGFLLADSFYIRVIFYAFALFLMLAMGFYFLGFSKLIAPFEKFGGMVWAKIFPKTQQFLPITTKKHAFFLGVLWGFMPCGLLYSAFAAALASGNALKAMLLMTAFSLGTLPNLLLAPIFLQKISARFRQAFQKIAGVVLILFALFGFYNLLKFFKIF